MNGDLWTSVSLQRVFRRGEVGTEERGGGRPVEVGGVRDKKSSSEMAAWFANRDGAKETGEIGRASCRERVYLFV